MSSQSFANNPFKKPHIENKIEEKIIINKVIGIYEILKFTKNCATNITTIPTAKPLITPPVINPINIV